MYAMYVYIIYTHVHVHVGIHECTCTCIYTMYVYMYTVTNKHVFYHLSIPLQWHSAINRTVMPKLKYPFLMKSSFHNDVKM